MSRQLQACEGARNRPTWLVWSCWAAPALTIAALVSWILLKTPLLSPASRLFNVSQRGREFRPGMLEISRGDVVRVVNDDGEISHHAYVATPTFSFDSGDQEPGNGVSITFSTRGTFAVLCGIHPKMRLAVLVR